MTATIIAFKPKPKSTEGVAPPSVVFEREDDESGAQRVAACRGLGQSKWHFRLVS
jgi:hypothetical protein